MVCTSRLGIGHSDFPGVRGPIHGKMVSCGGLSSLWAGAYLRLVKKRGVLQGTLFPGWATVGVCGIQVLSCGSCFLCLHLLYACIQRVANPPVISSLYLMCCGRSISFLPISIICDAAIALAGESPAKRTTAAGPRMSAQAAHVRWRVRRRPPYNKLKHCLVACRNRRNR